MNWLEMRTDMTAAEQVEHYKRVRGRRPPHEVAQLPAVKLPPEPPPPIVEPQTPIDPAPPPFVLPDNPPPGQATIRDIIFALVKQSTGFSRAALSYRRRTAPYVAARRMVFWLASELTDASLPQIGRWLDGMDHTSVLHSINRANELRHADPVYAALLDDMAGKVRELIGGAHGC